MIVKVLYYAFDLEPKIKMHQLQGSKYYIHIIQNEHFIMLVKSSTTLETIYGNDCFY